MTLLSVSQVYAPDEETYVGRVTKQWSGLGKELFTDADNFGISFPLDLDVNVKATLLGAVFLLVSVTFSINLLYTGKFSSIFGQIQDMVKPFVRVKGQNKHRAKITHYTVFI